MYVLSIGIIAEYNPLHNGHIYQINKIKEKYPDSLLVVILNGNFTQRGEPSILTKEDKVKFALQHNIDLVIELPTLYGTQSADKFADASLFLLNALNVDKIIFGSETNDINYLEKLAKKQLQNSFQIISKNNLSFPARINASLLEENKINPNDLLGISYIKTILKHNYSITYECIARTSNYHDLESTENIISASNIRHKWVNHQDIDKFLPSNISSHFQQIDITKLFYMLKSIILTNPHLEEFIDVKEGLENKLKKEVITCQTMDDLITRLKSRRYTYNYIRRMLCHLFLGMTKTLAQEPISYIHILGFNERGKIYIKEKKKKILLPMKVNRQSKIYHYEQTASILYDILTNANTYQYELQNKPIHYTPTLDKDSNQK